MSLFMTCALGRLAVCTNCTLDDGFGPASFSRIGRGGHRGMLVMILVLRVVARL